MGRHHRRVAVLSLEEIISRPLVCVTILPHPFCSKILFSKRTCPLDFQRLWACPFSGSKNTNIQVRFTVAEFHLRLSQVSLFSPQLPRPLLQRSMKLAEKVLVSIWHVLRLSAVLSNGLESVLPSIQSDRVLGRNCTWPFVRGDSR